jgi:hypothetical protein
MKKHWPAMVMRPLVLVGMGHVELIEGKTNEARQRFEAAISMSRGKKVTIRWC